MSEELIMNFDLPAKQSSIIKVIGVGGGGSNAVNHMFKQGITDVDFVICNTDLQALEASPVPVKIQLGPTISEGRGAGNRPEKGREAAIESLDHIAEVLSHNTKMVFITAGMGGGTGTGAAPIIAQEAQEAGILTVGIVTIPFLFEGKKRLRQAIDGLEELRQHVDALLVINNEKFREIFGDLEMAEAFAKADDILTVAAKGIAEIITVPGLVNVDFEDVYTVMNKSGVALMGSAAARGNDRAISAIQEALTSPLLNNNDIHGATNILLNITSGKMGIKIDEMTQITDYLQDAAGQTADIIWGANIDTDLEDQIQVTVIATGFSTDVIPELYARKAKNIINYDLDDNKNKRTPVQPEPQYETFEPNDTGSELIIPELDQDVEIERFELEGSASESFESHITIAPKNYERASSNSPDSTGKSDYFRNLRNIEEIERVPAYKRRKMNFENIETSDKDEEISRYTLSGDENDAKIRKSNSYLEDNAD
ncbi:MAG: cell division protein FtsZ [Salinivirgaceae bacterium]|nr:cell division protein FtsZ [Salinivirgaceae bacterium]MDD4746643.1 cell division protein FtsZ [Salinivirgaceae bacterium]MDY0279770.1 cell division protein FtsZ [Salinivirgaceae bacterium]